MFRQVFALGKGKNWNLTHSAMFLDFLAGNQEFHCTPWGMPTRNIFGWQKPCYLLGEGYAKTFTELMETTDWDAYGTGRYEKCANCMAHCGYEATAADAMMKHPIEAMMIGLRGVKTEGPMAPEIDMDNQRPAQYVFDSNVQLTMSDMRANEAREKAAKAAKADAQDRRDADISQRGVDPSLICVDEACERSRSHAFFIGDEQASFRRRAAWC